MWFSDPKPVPRTTNDVPWWETTWLDIWDIPPCTCMKTNNKTIAFRHFQDLFYFLLPPQIRPAPHRGGGVNSQVGDCLVKVCHQRWRSRPKNLLGRFAWWTGSPGTLKNWPTQFVGVGRTPQGARGILRPTHLLTLPGEDWSPPGEKTTKPLWNGTKEEEKGN